MNTIGLVSLSLRFSSQSVYLSFWFFSFLHVLSVCLSACLYVCLCRFLFVSLSLSLFTCLLSVSVSFIYVCHWLALSCISLSLYLTHRSHNYELQVNFFLLRCETFKSQWKRRIQSLQSLPKYWFPPEMSVSIIDCLSILCEREPWEQGQWWSNRGHQCLLICR